MKPLFQLKFSSVSHTFLFLSQFYHACDQAEFNYCLMPYTVLQFGDFYSSLTSVWLTAFIVAKPSVSEEISSAMSIAGAVAIAMAVHYNPTSFVSFIVPIVCGLILIIICWVILWCIYCFVFTKTGNIVYLHRFITVFR